jgi:DNA-directed RNA polymerase specialized sigma24 family protein
MIAESILVCALALPSGSFSLPDLHQKVEIFRQLRDFIHKSHPDADIELVKPGDILPGVGWVQLPFKWGEHLIFIREKPISDRKPFLESALALPPMTTKVKSSLYKSISVALLKKEDRYSWEELRAYSLYAAVRMGWRSPACEDVAQEACLAVVKAIQAGTSIKNVKSYVWQVLKYQRYAHLESVINRGDLEVSFELVKGTLITPSLEKSILAILIDQERKMAVALALATLTKDQKQVVTRRIRGDTDDAIMASMKINSNQFRNLLNHGLANVVKHGKQHLRSA